MKQWLTNVFHLLKNFLLKLGLHLHVEVTMRSLNSEDRNKTTESDDPDLK